MDNCRPGWDEYVLLANAVPMGGGLEAYPHQDDSRLPLRGK